MQRTDVLLIKRGHQAKELVQSQLRCSSSVQKWIACQNYCKVHKHLKERASGRLNAMNCKNRRVGGSPLISKG